MKKSDLYPLTFDEQVKQLEQMRSMSMGRRGIATLQFSLRHLTNAIYMTMSGTSPEASSYLWETLFGSEVAAEIDIDIENGHLGQARLSVENMLGLTEGICAILVETRKNVLEKMKIDKENE